MSDRLPSTVASAVAAREAISLRLALPADVAAVQRLADLSGRRLQPEALLVAEADGAILAAANAAGGVISDPFRVTATWVHVNAGKGMPFLRRSRPEDQASR